MAFSLARDPLVDMFDDVVPRDRLVAKLVVLVQEVEHRAHKDGVFLSFIGLKHRKRSNFLDNIFGEFVTAVREVLKILDGIFSPKIFSHLFSLNKNNFCQKKFKKNK